MKRMTLDLDEVLVSKAAEVLGTEGSITKTIQVALSRVVQSARLEQLAERTFEQFDAQQLDDLRRPR